jgi:hypothetical protein
VRLNYQPTGNLVAPVRGRAHADEEMPQTPQGPVPPPRQPGGTSPVDAGPDDTSPAGSSPAGAGQPEKSLAETRPAAVTSTDAPSANTRPDEPDPADACPAGTGPPGNHPAGAGPEGAGPAGAEPGAGRVGTGPISMADARARQPAASPAGASPADVGAARSDDPASPGAADRPASGASPASPGAADRPGPGASPGAAGSPPRVPARQGPPPKPAPRAAGTPATWAGAMPAVRPGAVPATRPVARPPAVRPGTEPSWGTVLATTFRLWVHRRMERTWWRVLAGLLVAAVLFGAGALTIALTRSTPAGNSSGASGTTRNGTAPDGTGSVGGSLGAVAAARKQAAAWVAHQVNSDEIIGCDPAMCAALEADHIQANRLLMLGPGQADPLGSEILMDTATLRSQFGSRLDSVYAPVSLAGFGAGAARVEVRVAAPFGAHAYLIQLAGDMAARKLAGSEMLRNSSIHVFPAARRQLSAGEVDTRLLVTLVTLAHSHPVDIISFGAQTAGASPGVPLRSAEIAGARGPGSTPAVSIQTLRTFLSAQQPPYRPSAIVTVKTASRRTVLEVEYPAPSLLGLLGTHG